MIQTKVHIFVVEKDRQWKCEEKTKIDESGAKKASQKEVNDADKNTLICGREGWTVVV